MEDPNQIIQRLRNQVAELTTKVSILQRDVAEESRCKYAAYQRIQELTDQINSTNSE